MKKIALLFTLMVFSLGFAQAPSSAAPTPPARIATDVISIYGSQYTNIGGVDINPNWGNQATVVTEVAIGGNKTLRYASFSYQGTTWENTPQNITNMEFLHIDIWTNNEAPSVFVISSGAEIAKPITSMAGSWQSLDIPVAGITADLTKAIQFKFAGGNGGTIYLDNMYFWKKASPVGTPVIAPLTVPSKIIGDAPFDLTAPSSNSPGAFTYTSSNNSVATISGNTVTIVGAGVSIITAIQAASAPYLTGQVSANLLVSGAPTVAAPTPPVRVAADVKSLFSDAYAPITAFAYSGDNNSYNTNWSPANTKKVVIEGNDTNQIIGLGTGNDEVSSFEAMSFEGGRIDATTFTHFHMDIWTATPTLDKSFNIKFSNWKGGTAEVNAIQYSGTNGNFLKDPNPGTWISIDIPLDDFTIAGNNLDRDDLVQFIITSNLGTVYYDNVYLYRVDPGPPPVASEFPLTAAPTPPARNAWDVKSIFSNAYAPVTTFAYTGDTNSYNTNWSPASTTTELIVGNATNKIVGLGTGTNEVSSFEGIAFQGGRIDGRPFTHFHMDIWTATATLDKSFNIKFSNWKGGTGEVNAIQYSGTNATFLKNPNPLTWISIDIPLSEFTIAGLNLDRDDLVQFIITSNLGTVYYDNLYLYRAATLGTTNFEKTNIKMYPNPAKNTLTIEAKGTINKLSVFNILGQEVMTSSPKTNTTTLQTNSLQKGVYIVKTDIDGVISTSKIVKE
ncbi:T9SS type A sorting domain-containing protein [Flavobacterium sp.]|uniref:T9SS type A sorting domain-containing protein n=1 Tax=Flavobacterium sp. TaxID=239 RepID=UPI00286E5B3D|nr:T9SS type A sorting domain-containing protein [Flavobacterium sp.]